MKVSSKIENIFCRIDFKRILPIDEKTAQEAGMEAAKSHLRSYIYTHPRLGVKMMIFPSGQVFMNGAKNHDEVESSFWALKKKLKELGFSFALSPHTEIEVENVMATGNIRDYLPDAKIDLEKISLKENAVYEPKKFPAVFLSFIVSGARSTAMVFPSGKVLIGDVRSHEDANIVLEKVIEAVRY